VIAHIIYPLIIIVLLPYLSINRPEHIAANVNNIPIIKVNTLHQNGFNVVENILFE
jgi:hypothetical protein